MVYKINEYERKRDKILYANHEIDFFEMNDGVIELYYNDNNLNLSFLPDSWKIVKEDLDYLNTRLIIIPCSKVYKLFYQLYDTIDAIFTVKKMTINKLDIKNILINVLYQGEVNDVRVEITDEHLVTYLPHRKIAKNTQYKSRYYARLVLYDMLKYNLSI